MHESKRKEDKEDIILKQIRVILVEDRVLQEKVRHQIEMFNNQDEVQRYAAKEHLKGIIRVLGGVALHVGPKHALQLAGGLIPLSTYFTGINLTCQISLLLVIRTSRIGDGLFQRYSGGAAQ